MTTIAVGTRKGLFRVIDGEVVDHHFAGIPVTLVLCNGDRWFAAIEHGHFGPKIHRSDDAGSTWVEVGAPHFPVVDEGEDGPSVQTIWALEGGETLWCGTIPGGLFRSDDQGGSWSLVESLWDRPERKDWFGGGADEPGIHSICIDPRDAKRLRIGISCGGVWETRDDGASWALKAKGMRSDFMPPERREDQNIQDPHCIVQSPSNPDVFWCQHHCRAYRSIDDGESWQAIEVPPSSFGFPVRVHPKDADTAWYVPATHDDMRIPVEGQVVVARTRDGGASFEVLREGLPQMHAYDLVFRHALDVDGTGDQLAFGSTTGTLWRTEDGGDTWITVSNHLPPIYAVRFA